MRYIECETILETYDIPLGFEAGDGIAIGHIGNPDDLSEKLRETELKIRTRKSLDEILFENSWGNHFER